VDHGNLKSGIGFVTKEDIAFRLYPFNLPEGERFLLEQVSQNFSQVAATFRGESLKLFHIYTGDPETYKFVGDLVRETAEELEKACEVKEWKDEVGRSEETVEASVGESVG